MFGQPNSISKADDDEVILPNNNSQVKVIRDKAPDGEGTYYGYLKSGVKEPIGGPGLGSFPVYQDATFVLSADGTTGSGTVDGDATKVSYNPLTKVMTFTTEKKLKLGFFSVVDDSTAGNNSDGRGNLNINNSQFSNISSSDSTRVDNTNSIHVVDATSNGWTGLITAITDTTFDITFTQVGSGASITGQAHLIEG